MAWRKIGDKPLSEPMLTWFTNTYMRHGGGGGGGGGGHHKSLELTHLPLRDSSEILDKQFSS